MKETKTILQKYLLETPIIQIICHETPTIILALQISWVFGLEINNGLIKLQTRRQPLPVLLTIDQAFTKE